MSCRRPVAALIAIMLVVGTLPGSPGPADAQVPGPLPLAVRAVVPLLSREVNPDLRVESLVLTETMFIARGPR